MQFEFENLTAEFIEKRAVIHQDYSKEAEFVMRFVLWAAFGGLVFLTAVGNIPFALFWFVFLISVRQFVKRCSNDSNRVVIDKTSGQMTCSRRNGGSDSKASYDLSQFTRVVLLWTRELADPSKQTTQNYYDRYRLCLFRPMSDEQVESELPPHLAPELSRSKVASKLILGTARAGGVNYIEITHGDLRSEQDVRALSDAVIGFLAPEYELVFEQKNAPSMFSKIHR